LLVILPSPYPEASARPSTPKVLQTKECALIPFPFDIFTFGLTVESIQKFGGASNQFFMRPIGLFQRNICMSIEYFKENEKDTYDFLKKMSKNKWEYN
jgi:hypothetical protein